MNTALKTQALNALDLGQLQSLRASAHREESGTLRKAAVQFEALFTQMMLKSMRDALPGDDTLGDQGEFYQGMYDQQLSLSLAGGKGMGLADLLVRQLSPTPRADEVAATSPAPNLPQSSASTTADAAASTAAPSAVSAHALLRARAAYSVSAGNLAFDTVPEAAWTEQQIALLNAAAAAANAETRPVPAASAESGKDSWTPGDVQGFIDAIRPHAERAARELGLPVRAVLAHAALETGWGRHVPRDAQGQPSFNLFGIKANRAWEGGSVNASTQEYRDGAFDTEQANFRSYGSLSQAFDDYVSFLKDNPRYLRALKAEGVEGFAGGLQRAGYATDPRYAQKLVKVAYGRDMNAAMNQAAEPAAAQTSSGQTRLIGL